MESRGVKTRAQQQGVPAEPPALWSVAGGIWTRFKKVAAMKRPPLREVVAIVDELRRSPATTLSSRLAQHDRGGGNIDWTAITRDVHIFAL